MPIMIYDHRMPKFYIKWQLNPLMTPAKAEERVERWLEMLRIVEASLKDGTFTDWGMCSDASGGYAFSNQSEADLYTSLLKYIPYVDFEVKPVLTSKQVIESIKKVMTGAQNK